ncbi:MAG: hypothetical protein RL238_882 [Actinomycetota bacterium]|jgi:hypothetical protein
MKDIIFGIVAILIGALFCFRGWLAMRVVIPIWGAFAGFVAGAGLIEALFGDGFLRTFLGWALGIVFAIVFFFLAYLYYEASVVIAMAFVGFALGVGVMSAIGVTWNWVLFIVGVVVGLALGFVAIITNLPMGLLTVLTAMGGATAIVAGTMLLFDRVNVDDFGNGVTTKDVMGDHPWWYVMYGALVVAGIVAQIALAERVDRTLREAWTEAGGKQLRSA